MQIPVIKYHAQRLVWIPFWIWTKCCRWFNCDGGEGAACCSLRCARRKMPWKMDLFDGLTFRDWRHYKWKTLGGWAQTPLKFTHTFNWEIFICCCRSTNNFLIIFFRLSRSFSSPLLTDGARLCWWIQHTVHLLIIRVRTELCGCFSISRIQRNTPDTVFRKHFGLIISLTSSSLELWVVYSGVKCNTFFNPGLVGIMLHWFKENARD